MKRPPIFASRRWVPRASQVDAKRGIPSSLVVFLWWPPKIIPRSCSLSDLKPGVSGASPSPPGPSLQLNVLEFNVIRNQPGQPVACGWFGSNKRRRLVCARPASRGVFWTCCKIPSALQSLSRLGLSAFTSDFVFPAPRGSSPRFLQRCRFPAFSKRSDAPSGLLCGTNIDAQDCRASRLGGGRKSVKTNQRMLPL